MRDDVNMLTKRRLPTGFESAEKPKAPILEGFNLKTSRIWAKIDLHNRNPSWGDASVLEKNWAGSRSKAIKSLLALVAQDPSTGNLSYTNSEVKHRNQSDAIFDFVDFWKQGRGVAPKMLIFDSKFTTYRNLSELNRSEEKSHVEPSFRAKRAYCEGARKKQPATSSRGFQGVMKLRGDPESMISRRQLSYGAPGFRVSAMYSHFHDPHRTVAPTIFQMP